MNTNGTVVGELKGPPPGQGPHFNPHEIAVDGDGSIFTVEVMGWRAQKFLPIEK